MSAEQSASRGRIRICCPPLTENARNDGVHPLGLANCQTRQFPKIGLARQLAEEADNRRGLQVSLSRRSAPCIDQGPDMTKQRKLPCFRARLPPKPAQILLHIEDRLLIFIDEAQSTFDDGHELLPGVARDSLVGVSEGGPHPNVTAIKESKRQCLLALEMLENSRIGKTATSRCHCAGTGLGPREDRRLSPANRLGRSSLSCFSAAFIPAQFRSRRAAARRRDHVRGAAPQGFFAQRL